MPPNFKNKFVVMSYNMEKFPWVANLQTKLKPEESSIILYCLWCCPTNCHYGRQLKTIFVFDNWYQLLLS